MRRRTFVKALTAAPLFSRVLRAESFPPDLRITRAVSFDLISRRSKLAGKNARRDVHGNTARDRMVRLYTNVGVDAVARCWRSKESVAQLLGTNPFADFDPASRRIVSPLERRTMVLWDLAGRLLGKPVSELLGATEPQSVPVYDGSIYFADLLPQYAARWRDRFREEIDMGLERGHRAFKIKIGRGNKWMNREEGDLRDLEVVETIRKHAGPEVILGVDANNGYDLAGAKRFLNEASEHQLAFIEEPFPEQVAQCLELKQFIAEHGWQTYLADGEGQHELDAYKPFVDAQAIDILQGDMNQFGIEGILAEAAMARPQGIQIAPHNWGSLLGFIQQVHVGQVVSNFYRAEQDPLSSDVLITEGYTIREGVCTTPDAPGFGLRINEEKFRHVKINFDLRV
jgi:L-alanine-DL-glutamate epimerase-like enolase superfamily enzyme